MDAEGYVIYGMAFGFLTLWLLFAMVKKLGGSEKFPQAKKRIGEDKD